MIKVTALEQARVIIIEVEDIIALDWGSFTDRRTTSSKIVLYGELVIDFHKRASKNGLVYSALAFLAIITLESNIGITFSVLEIQPRRRM
ncbi:hypothetical protein LOAG_09912 [Loa loa]|uniref:Uncharacterized protein n=1 Tax=Loa loa TaxID=7209 RepID=A0A1S0TQX8_LOALO|nr:hypothetical protein LOAG_09912 [Loa loa]EFO18581.2 hypothetical protein LOAG_09912 [Loa loa]